MKKTLIRIRGVVLLFILHVCIINTGYSQDCSGLTASYITTESRCTATGSLQINTSGGSGTYNYKLQGAATSDFTSSSLITGLKPGIYSVIVKDIISNCIFEIDNIIIAGTYSDPRFGIGETDVTCMNGSDGKIFVSGLTDGRSPFIFSIVPPSASGIGLSNSTGSFTGLIPGSYTIQLTDSCGGIQTRNISIQNYNWSISSAVVSQVNCTSYHAQISLTDSKGNSNGSGTAFNGFTYGFVNGPADTTWFTSGSFDFDLGQKRNLTLVAKDNCGLVQTRNWSNNVIPSVQTNVNLTGNTCTGFNASIGSLQNLSNPNFCLLDNLGNPVSGQPCNTSGVFNNLPYGSYCIKITNTCYDTIITRCFTQAQPAPAVSGVVSLSNYTCTSFQATVTGQQNLSNPQYCLLDNAGNSVSGVPCNASGIFPNLPYGSYKIQITDGCTGTLLNLNFSAAEKIKSVASSVTLNNYTCTTFDAAISGQTNLSSPQYCLVDAGGNPVTCNSTGIFTNIPYGSYCINITDACNDTTIQRCMTVLLPDPSGGNADISNQSCSGFTVTISGQKNIFNGLYCLQDNAGNPIAGVACNTTGVFNNVPYGSYCVKTTDGCSGKTMTNCFTVSAPVPSVGPAVISNINCTGFTATITGQQNLTTPSYCLYDSLNNLIGTCNSTGLFVINGFGSYHIITTDGCNSAVFTTNFSLYKPVPAVSPNLNFTNQTCTDFTATVTGQTNLFNPQYFLKDNSGNPVSNNSTGIFSNLLYGSYCLDIVNGCLDTTITRCFTLAPDQTQVTITAAPSCLYNASDISIQVTKGFGPYSAAVYNAADSLLTTSNSGTSQISFTGLPALDPGNQYKIIVTGSCGLPATQLVTGQQSNLSHVYTITPKCPSSITPNGSGDLLVHAITNIGALNMSIISKGGVPTAIGYSYRSGNDFTFSNLDADTYIVAYSFSGCSTIINDTISLPNYVFPVLAPSGAYQCDNNSFSVGASVTGGMAPYNYQIIGSIPSAPSINSATQSSPVFTISNGVQYSLVRLRALDACGNATLNDVSILPLANTIVTATSNCIYKATTLSTDYVANASWTWFKKSDMSSTDSVVVGTDPTYSIAAISVADTGIYVNRMTVNNGCLTRLSYFHLDGMCNGLFTLAVATKLNGKALNETSNQLTWNAATGDQVEIYALEKLNSLTGQYDVIGTVNADGTAPAEYNYIDPHASSGDNYYRLKMTSPDNRYSYSNIVLLKSGGNGGVTAFPNPVRGTLTILFQNNESQQYHFSLVNVIGQQVYTSDQYISKNGSLIYHRDNRINTGTYFLQISDSNHAIVQVLKLNFE